MGDRWKVDRWLVRSQLLRFLEELVDALKQSSRGATIQNAVVKTKDELAFDLRHKRLFLVVYAKGLSRLELAVPP